MISDSSWLISACRGVLGAAGKRGKRGQEGPAQALGGAPGARASWRTLPAAAVARSTLALARVLHTRLWLAWACAVRLLPPARGVIDPEGAVAAWRDHALGVPAARYAARIYAQVLSTHLKGVALRLSHRAAIEALFCLARRLSELDAAGSGNKPFDTM